ncbi:MAG: hypothetical protein LT067_00720 [Sulfurovum sp.]|nr:hypothetical protein [Sulfurovum sp.]
MDPRVKPEDDKNIVIPAKAGIQMSMDSKPMDPRVKPEDDGKISWIPGRKELGVRSEQLAVSSEQRGNSAEKLIKKTMIGQFS